MAFKFLEKLKVAVFLVADVQIQDSQGLKLGSILPRFCISDALDDKRKQAEFARIDFRDQAGVTIFDALQNNANSSVMHCRKVRKIEMAIG